LYVLYQIHPFSAEFDIWPLFCVSFYSFFMCNQFFFLSRGTRICPLSVIFKFLNVYYFLFTGLFRRQAWSIKVNKCLSITFAVNSLSVKFVIILLSKDLWPWYYNIYHENCWPPRYTQDQKLSIILRCSPIFKQGYLTYS
jgi:hypothetical protein